MQRGRGTPGIQMFEGLKKGVRIVDENTAWLILDSKSIRVVQTI